MSIILYLIFISMIIYEENMTPINSKGYFYLNVNYKLVNTQG